MRGECAFGGYGLGRDRCFEGRVRGSLMCREHRAWAARMTIETFPLSKWAQRRAARALGRAEVRRIVREQRASQARGYRKVTAQRAADA